MRPALTIVMLALTASVSALPARAQSSDDERYTIMRPEPGQPVEPWLPPKYVLPRGTKQHVVIPRPSQAPPMRTEVPPPLLVPETGRVLPNLPPAVGAGPNGSETFQDRSARCAHQAGVYGASAGDPGSYIRSCINQ